MDLKILKTLRKQRRISIKAMCKATGLHRETIARIESGSGNPSFQSVEAYIEALNDVELTISLKK